ncbi:26309_t:CDS:2, partial [Gigaspora margarita]
EETEEQPEVKELQNISSRLALQIEQIEHYVLPKSRRQSDFCDGSSWHDFIALEEHMGEVLQQTDNVFD